MSSCSGSFDPYSYKILNLLILATISDLNKFMLFQICLRVHIFFIYFFSLFNIFQQWLKLLYYLKDEICMRSSNTIVTRPRRLPQNCPYVWRLPFLFESPMSAYEKIIFIWPYYFLNMPSRNFSYF